MKKLIVTALIVLGTQAAYALPVGNPAEASLHCTGLIWDSPCCDPCNYYCDPCELAWCDAWSLRVGFYGDYVFKTHLEVENSGKDIDDIEIYTNAGYVALNFFDRFDVFATFGASHFSIDTNTLAFETSSGDATPFLLESETAFSWSIGGRVTIWQCGCTYIGAEAQYFNSKPHITRFSTAAIVTFPGNDFDACLSEWQVGLGIAHQISRLVPYLAAKWSNTSISIDDTTFTIPGAGDVTLKDLESKNHWGFALGATYLACDIASVTVEGRFGNEKAVYVNGQVRF